MDKSQKTRKQARRARVMRVRKNLHGTDQKPRLSVSRTNCHIYAQLIDDDKSLTLAGFGTLSKDFGQKKRSKEAAREIGKVIGRMAKEKNIHSVVFDRGRYKFHGIVAELASGAREAGLQF
jgi:large subunit ribosomal protein L18